MSQVAARPAATPGRPPVPARGPVPPGAGRPGGPVPVGPAPGGGRGPARARSVARSLFEGSPGRLRLVGIGAVAACLVFALLGSWAFQARGNALAGANANVAQLIRVQQIATELVKADSLLANGYLTYGQESPQQQAAYDTAIANASRLISQASAANPDDAALLSAVNRDLSEYTARAASARDNNRANNPVGTGYLRQAGALLRGGDKDNPNLTTSAGMVPTLNKVITAATDRVDGSYSASRLATWLLLGAALIAVGGLVAVQIWLARRTRRYLNVPLVASGAVVLVVLIVGSVLMVSAQNRADKVYDTSYKALINLEGARIDAYAAKSAESVSLIYIGTGGNYGAFEATYQDKVKDARNKLTAAADAMDGAVGQAELAAWTSVHQTVYKQALTDWTGAAKAATALSGSSLNGTFEALDTVTQGALENQGSVVDTGLGNGTTLLVVVGWLALVIGLIAGVVAWSGIAQRLEEYR